MTKRTLVAWVLTTASFSPAALAQTDGERVVDWKTMREDLEIMRRILAKSLSKSPAKPTDGDAQEGVLSLWPGTDLASTPDKYSATLGYYDSLSLLDAAQRFSAQGFYVPHSGVFFSIAMSAPVKEAPDGERKREKSKSSDDAWDRTRDEVRSGETSTVDRTRSAPARRFVIDSNAVDDALQGVLRVIGEHGLKIRQLGSGDALVVAIRFQAAQSTYSVGATPPQNVLDYFERRSAPAQSLVVRVPIAVLLEHKDQSYDADSLKDSRVSITRY